MAQEAGCELIDKKTRYNNFKWICLVLRMYIDLGHDMAINYSNRTVSHWKILHYSQITTVLLEIMKSFIEKYLEFFQGPTLCCIRYF